VKRLPKIRIGITALAVWAVALAQSPQSEPTPVPVGSATVAEVKGAVTLKAPDSAALTPQRGLVLAADSTIETDKGSILLALQDGSQVLVKPHSRVVLRAPNQGKGYYLELFLGKIVNKIQKRLGDTPSFRMGTPSAVITVRGTRFEVRVNKKLKTFVVVYEGLVEVSGFATGPPVLLRPGFSTGVDRDRVPESPHQIGAFEDREGFGREGIEREGLGREGGGNQQGQRPESQDSHESPDD
jgi:ferric-dicitrate binding protein FerR (iron transport regulator)